VLRSLGCSYDSKKKKLLSYLLNSVATVDADIVKYRILNPNAGGIASVVCLAMNAQCLAEPKY